ncbi:hypothetical protein DDE18_08365 [Nocardioides gansuensis]|uniref:DUF2785 domain-containing protein n=1 Tax=Nocardioides gansuensis TaxID=2138300 RepID=A0A2T8FC65_9ACTN|nr:DUF2785 domain-containing protein [Nocardioides gansuensis]PVG83301.1 hypothetical protein DDE18_08365 [Nocardioides gansuensis]
MGMTYWDEVMRTGLAVPGDRPLDDLTAELTTMLGDPDPARRDGIAFPALVTWIARGVYDDLLVGLGDGIAAGLSVGIGESGTDTVFRRSFSALVLGEVIARTTDQHRVPGGKVLEWGDRLASWFVRERDCRGYVPAKGWAHAVAHGADAVGTLAQSPHLAGNELTVVLDVIADRLLRPGTPVLTSGEPDRIAAATMAVLRRNVVGLKVLEPWIARIAAGASPHRLGGAGDPYAATANPQAFLRALYLQLSLAPEPPQVRPDLILVLVDALRATNAPFLAPH